MSLRLRASRLGRHAALVSGLALALAGVAWLNSAPGGVGAVAQPPDARQQLIDYLNGIARTHLGRRAQTMAGVRTRDAALRRQADVRAKLLRLIGGLPERPATQTVIEHSRSERDGFTLENLAFESVPGFWVTANAYVPKGPGPFPAVVLAPGHSVGGKTELWLWGANFARNGVLALAYDPLGQGERLQYYNAAKKTSEVGNPTGEHGEANIPPMLIGETVARYMVNDARRAVDYLVGRRDVDAGRIGAFGCSGGGVTTAYLAALDERVSVAASACYITSFDKLLVAPTGVQEAEQSLPGFLAEDLDFADWVEAAAPRPFAIVSTTDDMFPFEGARETYVEASRFFSLFSAAHKLQWITGPGSHGNLAPISADILNFFLNHFAPVGKIPNRARFVTVQLEDPGQLRSTPTGQVATSFDGETVASLTRLRASALVPPASPADTSVPRAARRARLQADIRALTGVVVPTGASPPRVGLGESEYREAYRVVRVSIETDGGGPVSGALVLPSGGSGNRVSREAAKAGPAGSMPRRPVTLMIDGRPISEWLSPDGAVDQLVRSGAIVLVVNPRPTPPGTESIKSPYLGPFNLLSLRAFLVGRTILGLRIDDTIRAMNWLASRSDVNIGEVTVAGRGPHAMVALHAAVLDERIGRLTLEDLLVSYRSIVDEPLHREVSEVVVPGVLRRYDVEALLAAVGRDAVQLVGPRLATGGAP